VIVVPIVIALTIADQWLRSNSNLNETQAVVPMKEPNRAPVKSGCQSCADSNPYFITKDLKEKKRSTDQRHELASGPDRYSQDLPIPISCRMEQSS